MKVVQHGQYHPHRGNAPKRGFLRLIASGVFVLSACFVVLVGCGRQPTLLEQDQSKFPVAVRLYQSGCITCHGNNLQGGIGPNLQHVGARMGLAAIQHQIQVGGGPMPAYALPGDPILTPGQIHALSVWLESKK